MIHLLFRRALASVALIIALGLALAQSAQAFETLVVTPIALQAHYFSEESRFAHQRWDQIEAATLKLADRTLGSFEGEPTGMWSRPLRIHYRIYQHRYESRGAVVSLHLARRGKDTPFAAVALITPMHEPTIAGSGLSQGVESAARRWCDVWSVQLPFQLPWLSTQRVAGQDFDLARAAFENKADRADNDLSHSVPRLMRRWADRAATCEGEHCGHGDAKIEGPTLRWVSQACSGSRQARGPEAAQITVQVLLINGGQDSVVEAAAQREFCDHVNTPPSAGQPARTGRCVAYTLPNARHAVLVEVDSERRPALAHTLAFFDCIRSGGAGPCR